MTRPTMTELMQILESEEAEEIEILPNGEIRAKGTSHNELAGQKPITMRENLGGEYVRRRP